MEGVEAMGRGKRDWTQTLLQIHSETRLGSFRSYLLQNF